MILECRTLAGRVGSSRRRRALTPRGAIVSSCALAACLAFAGLARADELGLNGPAVAPLDLPVFTRNDLRSEPAPLFVILPRSLDAAVFTARDLAPEQTTATRAPDVDARETTAAISAAPEAKEDAASGATAAGDEPVKSAAIAPSGSETSGSGTSGLAPAAPTSEPASAPASPPASAPAASASADPAPSALREAIDARLSERARGRAAQLLRKQREEISEAYAARGDAPFWIAHGRWTPAARGAFEQLGRADEDGLDLGAAKLAALGEPGVEAELALSEAVAVYARQAAGGRVEPWRIASSITAKPPVATATQALGRVAAAGDPQSAAQALRDFNPPHPGYLALRDKLAEMRAAAPRQTHAPIPAGPTLKLGMRDARVPSIRARLSLADPVATADGRASDADPTLYDRAVVDAVKAFQRENGLTANGRLTPLTASALSGDAPSRMEAEIVANMERWRWLPRDLGATHIEVNIPEFRVALMEGDKTVFTTRAVVGKPESPTPVFSDTMRYLVVNPTWTMPPSILEKEALPNLMSDPDYYAKRGYEVIQKNGKLIVRQPPGERNALGHIKFMFPNDHAVYLHDTPSRSLFQRDRRAFSHGCVRVDQPFDLAEAVLDRKWSAAGLRKLIGPKERTISLEEPLPIHLTYFTARVDAHGRLIQFEDLYGYSRRLRAAMGTDGDAALVALGPTAADAVAAADRAKRRTAAAARKARAKQDNAARAQEARAAVSQRQAQAESRAPRSFFDWLRSGGGEARDPALSGR